MTHVIKILFSSLIYPQNKTFNFVFFKILIVIYSCSIGLSNANYLTRFLQKLESLNVRYVQVEVDESSFDEKISYGQLIVKVPGKFLWKSNNNKNQQMIADGTNLWIYEPSLSQASLYKQDTILINTPIILISSPQNFNDNFRIDTIREDEMGAWFDLSPKSDNSYYDYVEVRVENEQISQLVISNRINNFRTRIELYYDVDSLNQPISNALFQFYPPKGIDILKE